MPNAAVSRRYEVKPLDRTTRDDFFSLHCSENGGGWCYCVAWYLASFDGWDTRIAEDNRILREGVLRTKEGDGYLAYSDRQPVGWCQVEKVSALPGLWNRVRSYVPEDAFAVSCFFVASGWRRKGVGQALLAFVVDALRARHIELLTAFPRGDPACDKEDECWIGPYRLCEKQGFVRNGGSDDWPMLALRLAFCNS